MYSLRNKEISFQWHLANETTMAGGYSQRLWPFFRSARVFTKPVLKTPNRFLIQRQSQTPPAHVEITPSSDTKPEPALRLITPPQPRQCTSSTQKCPPSPIGPLVIRAPYFSLRSVRLSIPLLETEALAQFLSSFVFCFVSLLLSLLSIRSLRPWLLLPVPFVL